MMTTRPEAGAWRTLPRLDRLGVLSALVAGTTLAWIFLFRLADGMTGAGQRGERAEKQKHEVDGQTAIHRRPLVLSAPCPEGWRMKECDLVIDGEIGLWCPGLESNQHGLATTRF